MICERCGTAGNHWWGEDVVPRFNWRIYRDGIELTVRSGEVIPHGYGIAYCLMDRDVAVVMPVPLNVIVATWRRVKQWFRVPPFIRDQKVDEARRAGFSAGHAAGYAAGHRYGRQSALDMMAACEKRRA